MEEAKIEIACQGAITVRLEDLNELHHFKETTDEQYSECLNSMIELGFSFPFSVWIDPEGKKWTVDGHGRLHTLTRRKDEGGTIPEEYPANIVFAKDKKEAIKKVVANDSQFGKPKKEKIRELFTEYEIGIDEVENWLDIPEITTEDLFTFPSEEPPISHEPELQTEQTQENTETESKPEVKKEIECPNCHSKFTL